jgi:hypothetical protein
MSSSSCQSGSASQPPDNAATATEKDPWTTSVDKWDELRPVIEELYINQNKQLKEVTATMARDHKLRGTYVQ